MRRWSITSPKPFDAVVAALEEAIGKPNIIEFIAKMTAATGYEEMQEVVHDSVSEIYLMGRSLTMVPSWQKPESTEIPNACA
jgi:hypothetical protein